MDPERSRIAAVLGDGQGSGYLLTRRLVLTAGHLVKHRAQADVVVLGGAGRRLCKVVWKRTDRDCDAALLLAREDLVAATDEEVPPVRWGTTSGLEPLQGCQAVGFPHVQRDAVGALDTEQVVGTCKPGSRMVRSRYVLDSAHTPPRRAGSGASPWAGMSGAALFADGRVIGVVVTDPEDWRHGRLEAVRSSMLLEDPEFLRGLRKHTGYEVSVTDLSGAAGHHPHSAFENRYRAFVGEYHSELTIFGLDFRRQEHAQWPLDTAYLSLEVVPQAQAPAPPAGGAAAADAYRPETGGLRQRVESAFARQTRIMLRGNAGSGKTTLVQWLAVSAARGEWPAGLGHLSGCIPFVLPLRTLARRGDLPWPQDFLAAVNNPLREQQPAGWADEVLRSGRGLLLVDGVDEVQEADRARTRRWLRQLVTLYPDCVYLVTSRPSAVDDGWLAPQAFTELNLMPMSRQDVMAFLRRWHKAASRTASRAEEREELTAYEQALTDALPRKNDLARLATNPLMCAMICALNRDRRTHLPQNRIELYEAALSALLLRRDLERDIDLARHIAEDAQRRLLQQLAHWMIRNGQAEADRGMAVRVVAEALRAMPQVGPPEEAEDVLEHLLLRSGLLRAPTTETVEFVHRTFQDYLGAEALVEGQDLGLVALHAHEPQWEDVVRMTVGRARPQERAALLGRLLDLGDAAQSPQRERLHLLAAACLEQATALDPRVRAEVERRAAALVPPESLAQAVALSAVGTVVLDLLPAPSAVTAAQARAVVHTAYLIGGEQPFQVMQGYRAHPDRQVRQQLVDSWEAFEARPYAEHVLTHVRLDDLRVTVTDGPQLAALELLGRVPSLACVGDFPAERLGLVLRRAGTEHLVLRTNDSVTELDWLVAEVPALTSLGLNDCGGLEDVTALPRLPGLRRLSLENVPEGPDLAPVRQAEGIRAGVLGWSRGGPPRRLDIADLPFPSGLEVLSLNGNLRIEGLDGLRRFGELASLEISAPLAMWEAPVLAALPKLRHLSVNLEDLGEGEVAAIPGAGSRRAAPTVSEASVNLHTHAVATDVAMVAALWPGLASLRLTVVCAHAGRSPVRVDLSALSSLPGLEPGRLLVDVWRSTPGELRLVGAEALPAGALRVTEQEEAASGESRAPWWRRLGPVGSGRAE